MSPRWSSRSLGNRLQHAIFYRLIHVAGWPGAYALLFFVVLWYTLRPAVRSRSDAYIRRRFPEAGRFRRFVAAWRLQWNFGKVLVDRATAGIAGNFAFDTEAEEPLAALTREGKGVILLSAHTGCWQMGPQMLAGQTDLPVSVLVHKDAHDVDKQAHEHAGKAPPYDVIGAEDGPAALVALMNLLRRGQLLCMMGDRLTGGSEPSVTVNFLGSPVRLPYLAYRLASAAGVPIAVCFSLRTRPCAGSLILADVIRVPEGLGSKPEVYRLYAERYAAALEAFVREHPYQFFNFFNLWE